VVGEERREKWVGVGFLACVMIPRMMSSFFTMACSLRDFSCYILCRDDAVFSMVEELGQLKVVLVSHHVVDIQRWVAVRRGGPRWVGVELAHRNFI
jgi:hypothetical protein